MDLPSWFDDSEDELKRRKPQGSTARLQISFVPRVTMQNLICTKEGAALLWDAMTKVKFSYLLGKYFDAMFLQISPNQTTKRSYVALLSVS